MSKSRSTSSTLARSISNRLLSFSADTFKIVQHNHSYSHELRKWHISCSFSWHIMLCHLAASFFPAGTGTAPRSMFPTTTSGLPTRTLKRTVTHLFEGTATTQFMNVTVYSCLDRCSASRVLGDGGLASWRAFCLVEKLACFFRLVNVF